jgi:hypothetical protein
MNKVNPKNGTTRTRLKKLAGLALVVAMAVFGTAAKGGQTQGGNLMRKFGASNVSATFAALHAYLQSLKPGEAPDKIALGDYIDLPSISITEGYHYVVDKNFPTIGVYRRDRFIKPGAGLPEYGAPFQPVVLRDENWGARGHSLRLIVVGKNSFQKTNPDAPAHIVFQFQNVPIGYPMDIGVDEDPVNAFVYAGCKMRVYLNGELWNSLKASTGLDETTVYAPERFVSHGGLDATRADSIRDPLWLPTEWEIDGTNEHSNKQYENETNQARLEYYTTEARRRKYPSKTTLEHGFYGYWLASSYYKEGGGEGAAAHFCVKHNVGNYIHCTNADSMGGCAPAFCVR